MSGFRTGAAIRRIIVSSLVFAPFNASLRRRLGIDGLWNGYTPVILLSIGVFEVVMLSGQVRRCLSPPGKGLEIYTDLDHHRLSSICIKRSTDHLSIPRPMQGVERGKSPWWTKSRLCITTL